MKSELESGSYRLSGLGKVNILLGKNGVGKSHLLRSFDASLRVDEDPHRPNVLYVTPERGGELQYRASSDEQFKTQPSQVINRSRRNYSDEYRTVSFAKFSSLMYKVLAAFESATLAKKNTPKTRNDVVDEINKLLHRIDVRVGERPIFVRRSDGELVSHSELSSGEKELFCLAVDLLYFEYSAANPDKAIVLVDEPDVHVHPDMQARLGELISSIAKRSGIQFVISTHSTAFVSGMASLADIHITFMRQHQLELEFRPLNEQLRKLVPVFGAHPLTSLFSERPLLLVEGDNDEWMWHQAVRSSPNGSIKVRPVSIGGKPKFAKYEKEADIILGSLYDKSKAFSLRDGDNIVGDLVPLEHVERLRLVANDPENLLLSDEVLADHDVTWSELQKRAMSWLEAPIARGHSCEAMMRSLVSLGFDRVQGEVKRLSVLLAAELLGSNRPVPVILGKAIAAHCTGPWGEPSPTSMRGMLGARVYEALLQG